MRWAADQKKKSFLKEALKQFAKMKDKKALKWSFSAITSASFPLKETYKSLKCRVAIKFLKIRRFKN